MTAPAKTILVIEDEDNIAIALDYLISREGYAQERMSSGAGALERIRELRPDLVLLDVMLPGQSGYEICQQVRMDPALADVRILMMTARGSAIERRKGLAMGADGFISKPFELKELRDEVRRILHGDGGAADNGGAAGHG
ncbi:response regulator transcription factor [Alkalilacustris brevis]|uniref:response regulator transcription factor n=1 Tax=Alkalilacustris brevis TaxID=2026338 RepID=UPI000E0DF425|nr:response regulator [Alkalilacustris brevis]